jgi:chromosome segregation ATPase
MTYEELEAQLQKWDEAYEDQKAIIRDHQAKADYCEFKIIQIRQRMAELEQA